MQTLLDILKRAGGWNPGLYLKLALLAPVAADTTLPSFRT